MLRFGMGLGITLGANGLLKDLEDDGGVTQGGGERGRAKCPNGDGRGEIAEGVEASLAPVVMKVRLQETPISGRDYAVHSSKS